MISVFVFPCWLLLAGVFSLVFCFSRVVFSPPPLNIYTKVERERSKRIIFMFFFLTIPLQFFFEVFSASQGIILQIFFPNRCLSGFFSFLFVFFAFCLFCFLSFGLLLLCAVSLSHLFFTKQNKTKLNSFPSKPLTLTPDAFPTSFTIPFPTSMIPLSPLPMPPSPLLAPWSNSRT